MNNSLYAQIAESLNNREIIEMYNRNDDWGEFNLGKIIALGQDTYIYVSIDRQGRTDGIRLGYLDDIYRISNSSRYIDKYRKIIKIFDRDTDIEQYVEFFKNRKCGLNSFFEYALKNNKGVSLSLCNSNQYEITGVVVSYNEEMLVFNEIDDYGEKKTTSFINISDIDFCSCDSEDEKILYALMTEYHR